MRLQKNGTVERSMPGGGGGGGGLTNIHKRRVSGSGGGQAVARALLLLLGMTEADAAQDLPQPHIFQHPDHVPVGVLLHGVQVVPDRALLVPEAGEVLPR